MTAGRPLEGFRILDFCWIGAGALVTKTLAELGASVYRVESRTHPDNLRLSPPFRPGTSGIEASGYFASRNSSKRSIAIDMSTEEGRALARRLAERVDMVSSNFRPGIMERWGMGYEQLRETNPGVLSLTMPMQGADGPHSRFIGFGSTIAALSGLVALSGVPGRAPVGTGTHFPDHVPNPGHALVAVLAAIRHSRRTGEGQQIELSQLESTVNVLGPAIVAAGLGQTPQPVGNRVSDAAPHGAYQCRDGAWVVISCRTDEHWRALGGALGIPSGDATSTLAGRKLQESAVDQAVADAVARFDRTDLIGVLDAAGVPNAPVNSSRDIVEEKVLWERGFWRDIEHPVIGRIPINRSPFRLVGGPQAQVTRPPLLGEDTDAVLGEELGLDRAELDRLTAAKVLY